MVPEFPLPPLWGKVAGERRVSAAKPDGRGVPTMNTPPSVIGR
jgi:hypothetical protein